jgi:hypothetical protein
MTKTLATAGVAHYVAPSKSALRESRRMEPTGQRGEGAKVAAAFRGFFLLVGISAIAVVVFLIVSSAI